MGAQEGPNASWRGPIAAQDKRPETPRLAGFTARSAHRATLRPGTAKASNNITCPACAHVLGTRHPSWDCSPGALAVAASSPVAWRHEHIGRKLSFDIGRARATHIHTRVSGGWSLDVHGGYLPERPAANNDVRSVAFGCRPFFVSGAKEGGRSRMICRWFAAPAPLLYQRSVKRRGGARSATPVASRPPCFIVLHNMCLTSNCRGGEEPREWYSELRLVAPCRRHRVSPETEACGPTPCNLCFAWTFKQTIARNRAWAFLVQGHELQNSDKLIREIRGLSDNV